MNCESIKTAISFSSLVLFTNINHINDKKRDFLFSENKLNLLKINNN